MTTRITGKKAQKPEMAEQEMLMGKRSKLGDGPENSLDTYDTVSVNYVGVVTTDNNEETAKLGDNQNRYSVVVINDNWGSSFEGGQTVSSNTNGLPMTSLIKAGDKPRSKYKEEAASEVAEVSTVNTFDLSSDQPTNLSGLQVNNWSGGNSSDNHGDVLVQYSVSLSVRVSRDLHVFIKPVKLHLHPTLSQYHHQYQPHLVIIMYQH